MPFSITYTPTPLPPSPVQQRSIIADLRRAMLVGYADGSDLDAVGNNYDIPRPDNVADDVLYSNLVQLLAWYPKTITSTLYKLMEIVFGSQVSFRAIGQRPWRIYEVNANEIIIELPLALVATGQENASYLHGWSGYAAVPSGPSDQFTTPGDVTEAAATTLVGMSVYVITAPQTFTGYTIVSTSYDAPSDTSTVVVSASTLPAGGGFFYIDVPGDGVASYVGDYVASSGFVGSFSTAGGPTNTIEIVGDATRDVAVNDQVQLFYDGEDTTYIVVSKSYSSSTNLTTMVVNASTVPGGLSNAAIVRPQEQADGVNPPHSSRIYFTGTGRYEIVAQYLDLLVRAAGIIVRLEMI